MLTSGTRLGSYEVLAQIGAGGMGEVYQAHDSKLGRDVAIKVLPSAFANDPDRLSRFQREAKILASLNHPNIATIHGLEQSGGTNYLVMELVSGETLADRVKSSPVPVEEALKIVGQIAEALEAAHEKNIIHRDLKPANVKVTPEGKVKVLDFGLSKAFEADAANEDMNNSPTLSMAATMQGVILGTAGYMSPEQARGKPTDKRTDIWAFGCVLYELLSGKQTFHGETVTDITAKILTGEPDWQALPRSTPAQVRVLLKQCLQKDKTLRLRDAGDARLEIQEALAAPAPTETRVVARFGGGRQQIALLGIAGVVLLAIGGVASWILKPTPPRPVTRAIINLPPGQQLAGLEDGPALALSPDGTELAYVARQGNTQQIYLRAMDSLESKAVSGTEGAVNPFFSPDGQWLGFFSGGKLQKIPLSGGAGVSLADATFPKGASWSSEGIIAFTPITGASRMMEVKDSGGTPQPLTRMANGQASHRWPDFLPGGRALVFSAGSNALTFRTAKIIAQNILTGEQHDLIQGGGTLPRYALSGHLIYARGGALMAVPFDPERLAAIGSPVPVADGLLQSTVFGVAQYSLSHTGTLVYVPGGVESAHLRLMWVSRNGVEQLLPARAQAYFAPRLSPDGQRVAVGINEEESETWLYDLSRETMTRFTFGGDSNLNPTWTPDGKRIAFSSANGGALNLFWQLADGSGGLERLTAGAYTQVPLSFSPDGQFLAYFEVNPATQRDIWVLRMGDRKAQPFLQTPYDEAVPRFSPDGHWLAYISNESGRYEIYVQPFPGPGGKWQISTEGGEEPEWNPKGGELFYRSGDKMMAVDIITQPAFAVGKPRMLFEGRYEHAVVPSVDYAVSADGQRFLMLKPIEEAGSAPTHINVVLNWFEELKQKVPVGKK